MPHLLGPLNHGPRRVMTLLRAQLHAPLAQPATRTAPTSKLVAYCEAYNLPHLTASSPRHRFLSPPTLSLLHFPGLSRCRVAYIMGQKRAQ